MLEKPAHYVTAQGDPLGPDLILDELFDLMLYQELHKTATGDLREILGELIPVETRHLAFWQKFFHLDLNKLDWGRRVKLRLLLWACRWFGPTCVHLALEAIEVYGVRKYLYVWDKYQGQPLGEAVQGILRDEFEHEDSLVLRARERRIEPEQISDIFLGFNDGLVEILGAVSGFFAAFHNAGLVLMASFSVTAAGAFSMGAGAYVAASSGNEIRRTEAARKRFLGSGDSPPPADAPLRTGVTVFLSYFFGAMVPILPVLFGAHTIAASIATALALIILVSMVLAFLSGMDIKKRILINLAMISGAVALSYAIGRLAREVWGIAL